MYTHYKELKNMIFITNLLTVAVIFGGATHHVWAQSSSSEVRGAWLNLSSFDTPERRAATLQTAINANLNTLFVLAPPIGSNNGWSDPDDFSALVNEAYNLGLSVHAWILNMWRESGHDADFADSTEQQLQKQWVLDLLTEYPKLDGVNFDFIRYRPLQPVDETKMNGVAKTIQLAYQEVKNLTPRKFLTATSYNSEPVSADFSSEYIPFWFQNWILNNPGNKFTSPIYPDGCYVPKHMKYQQNSQYWIMDRIADAVMPMQYSTDDSIWNDAVDLWKSFLGDDIGKVLMGLGWYDGVGFDAPGLVRKIKYGRSQGLKGFVIYQIGAEGIDDGDLVSILTIDQEANDFDAPYKYPAISFVPVELSSFTAKAKNGCVILEWTTQTESDNLGFHIYRSNSKVGIFRQITNQLIKGAGNSETQHHYDYIDHFTDAGHKCYYKLAQIDFRGTIHLHGPISVLVRSTPEYALEQNYPNPFNPSTSISFVLEKDGYMSLKIYNAVGQLVRTLINETLIAGVYDIEWDGCDDAGKVVPSGTYIYSIEVNGLKVAKKMAFMK